MPLDWQKTCMIELFVNLLLCRQHTIWPDSLIGAVTLIWNKKEVDFLYKQYKYVKILSLLLKFNKIKFITGTNAEKMFLYVKYQVQKKYIHRAKLYKKWVRKFNIRCVSLLKGSLMTKQFAAKLDTNS